MNLNLISFIFILSLSINQTYSKMIQTIQSQKGIIPAQDSLVTHGIVPEREIGCRMCQHHHDQDPLDCPYPSKLSNPLDSA
ncbi:uncharacterized protein MELLADRAFT_124519 [Melampsora larici-populina 98AG31]|uniref:Secreted protein n=1 Tax=Melampsora larici-populina (strain 98AG31 / pathotype 3-4-7) TaxID=747676 RepID=F4RU90_MELLP|nr:uncharacterized protein MELLADRAFT_124519 [Melampsora larici-populina 98AG31]EGG04042.1 secreted protein [Melampsora larici-populina 98AG31]